MLSAALVTSAREFRGLGAFAAALRRVGTATVKLQADYAPVGAQFAGVAVARQEGVFAQRRCSVEYLSPVVPGNEAASIVHLQQTLSGDDVAVGVSEQSVFLQAQADGLPVIAFSAMLQRSPLALLGTATGPQFQNLEDLRGHAIGVAPDTFRLMEHMLRAAQIDDVEVRTVSREDRLDRLISGELLAVQSYSTTEPLELATRLGMDQPQALNVLSLDGICGIELGYAQVLFATADSLACESRRFAIRTFLGAMYEGWRRALADPLAAAEAVQACEDEDSDTMPPTKDGTGKDFHERVLKGFGPLLHSSMGDPMGSINLDRWLRASETMANAGIVGKAHIVDSVAGVDRSLWPGTPQFPALGSGGRCMALDGQALAAHIRAEASAIAGAVLRRTGRAPCLDVVRAPLAQHVRRTEMCSSDISAKRRTSWFCMKESFASAGIEIQEHELPADTPETTALGVVEKIAASDVDGVMIELPLPPQLRYDSLTRAVPARKRIDHLDTATLGAFVTAKSQLPEYLPATPLAVLEAFRHAGVAITGRSICIVGHGRIVGAPLAQILRARGATVTSCHSRTPAQVLLAACASADILVAAAGQPGIVAKEYVKPGAVVVNVGTHFDDRASELVPDCTVDVVERASLVLGCPGGLGPIPLAVLQRTVALRAAQEREAVKRDADEQPPMQPLDRGVRLE